MQKLSRYDDNVYIKEKLHINAVSVGAATVKN